jgi:glycogen operon protein
VSFNERHNEANGEDNADGHADNYSSNWGDEGPTEDEAIRETRGRVKRAMLTTLFASHGTPMLLGGDEAYRTQHGNNNAYCQDNAISWMDWERAAAPQAQVLTAFVARLAALRRAYPVLRSKVFLHGREEMAPGILDIAWFDERGEAMTPEIWNDPEGRRLMLRRAGRGLEGGIDVVALAVNASGEAAPFVLPPAELSWRLLIDSADPLAQETSVTGEFTVEAHSAAILAARLEEEAS